MLESRGRPRRATPSPHPDRYLAYYHQARTHLTLDTDAPGQPRGVVAVEVATGQPEDPLPHRGQADLESLLQIDRIGLTRSFRASRLAAILEGGTLMAEAKEPTTTGEAQVSVPVPQDTNIKVTSLKGKTDKEIEALLEKAKRAKVGFIIVNAPFKVQPVR
jgi:hypothetical protein